MTGFFSPVIEFILLFGLMIFTHEMGHFVVARLFRIEIEEFGFGFPPRLARLFKLGGTEFTLNWIPLGGFVRPKGENDPDVPGGLAAASPWARLSVLFGGPVMNLLFGIILFSFVFFRTGAPDTRTVLIVAVNPGSPAEAAGLLPGDVIAMINGETMESTQELSATVQQNLGKEIRISFYRNDTVHEGLVVPRLQPPAGQGALGISMSNPIVPISWVDSIPLAVRMTYYQGRQLILLPVQLIRGGASLDQARLVGPKGMYDIYQQARERDLELAEAAPADAAPPAVNTLFLMATISVALGLTNLLPIPALDGGRLLFILPELLLRRRVPQRYENLVHLIGFATLLALMIYITTQDIIHPIILP
ncbi:MAG: M50 family metallopeptidase [Anaerolineaceae bacterium]|nr:M50 family metallopeptidase [Anaerolineaceae bacterium]